MNSSEEQLPLFPLEAVAATPATDPPTSATTAPTSTATALGGDPGLRYTGLGGVARMTDGKIYSLGVELIETEKSHGYRIRAGMDTSRRIHEVWGVAQRAVLSTRPNAVGIEDYETREPKGVSLLKEICGHILQLRIPPSREAFIEQLKNDRWAKSWIGALAKMKSIMSDEAAWATRGLGQAAKTIGVQWVIASAAWQIGVPTYVYTPTMLKQRVTALEGRPSREASKADIGRILEAHIIGLGAYVELIKAPSVRSKGDSQAAADRASHVHDASGIALLTLLDYEEYVRTCGNVYRAP